MKLTDIHSAKTLKYKLYSLGIIPQSFNGQIVRISQGVKPETFIIQPLGGQEKIFTTNKDSASILADNLKEDRLKINRYIFQCEFVDKGFIEVQAYCFQAMEDFQTSLEITVSERVLSGNKYKFTLDKIKEMFIWNEMGKDALFSVVYSQKTKNQKADIRLYSDKCVAFISISPLGYELVDIKYEKDKYNSPKCVLFYPNITFIKENQVRNNNFAKGLDLMSAASINYFTRWEAYNELEKQLMKNEADTFGEIKYTKYSRITSDKGSKYIFIIEGNDEPVAYGTELAVKRSEGIINDVWVGTVEKSEDGKIITSLEKDDVFISIPQKGFLILSTIGNQTIIKRREKAKTNILNQRTPIKLLQKLIEEGVSEYVSENNWKNDKAVTQEFEKNFEKAKILNDNQKRALEIAINTPDIALIQGPPGTGKTTVIKAIIERFRETFERDNNNERPRILVSSFQNEAVDNAIEGLGIGDVPAYRIGRKSDVTYKTSVSEWAEKITEELASIATDQVKIAFTKQFSELSDDYFAYKKSGEKIEDAVKLIKKYLQVTNESLPQVLLQQAKSVTKLYSQVSVEEDEENPIKELLENQRMTKEGFEDDGKINAKRLLAHINICPELNISQSNIEILQTVIKTNGEKNFDNFIEIVKALRDKYISKVERIDFNNKVKIDELILNLSNVFYNQRISANDDLESKKSLIVGEFLEKFQNEVLGLVEKYSLTTAATCQSALKFDGDRTYDLVIVDEAARATPLDLLIPMSLGKKIILVGDHKQLPHMLEPEVVKIIESNPKYSSLPDIGVSLFERLFDMFKKGPRAKSVLLDTQYRMHPLICKFVSDAFYDGLLQPGITEADRVSKKEIFNGQALCYINITKNNGLELGGESKSRTCEVTQICKDLKYIFEVSPKSIVGIITFYSKQAKAITNAVNDILNEEQKKNVKIGTVDEFQGKEFDIVLLSAVRANNQTENIQRRVGFLTKTNRVCVAFSRAKYQFVVYADNDTVQVVEGFKKLYEICAIKREGYYCEF